MKWDSFHRTLQFTGAALAISRGDRNAEFEKTCAKTDPDLWLVFQAAMKPDPQTDVRPQPVPVHTAQAGAAAPPRVATDAFGVSPSGEVRGWVALMRMNRARTLNCTSMATP